MYNFSLLSRTSKFCTLHSVARSILLIVPCSLHSPYSLYLLSAVHIMIDNLLVFYRHRLSFSLHLLQIYSFAFITNLLYSTFTGFPLFIFSSANYLIRFILLFLNLICIYSALFNIYIYIYIYIVFVCGSHLHTFNNFNILINREM